jgi:tetratricopeptide (TPR) repeat protein
MGPDLVPSLDEGVVKSFVVALGFVAAAAFAAGQEEHRHSHGEAENFGTVHFPSACLAETRETFTRAVAQLHSFGYEESRRSFEEVARRDPSCGIAYWGIAMTWYHPLWAPPGREELSAGRAAAEKAAALGGKTERETAYIAAIEVFYRDSAAVPHGPRAAAYGDAMEALTVRFPEDHEARIFYALSLLGTAPPLDATYANQKKAAAILNALLPLEPEHPGIAHYMIHSFDYPELAADALPAARAYSKIAPSSAHALHMPSHIFTRLGLWPESIDSNLASAESGRQLVAKRHPGAASFDTLHAMDYLEYAYLQRGDDRSARAVLEEAAKARTFDEGSFAAGYALAAIPARWALERRDWKAAAALQPSTADLPWDRFAYAGALTQFGRAIGAARSGHPEAARESVGRLAAIQAGLAQTPIAGPYDWAAQVESMRLAAAAWVAFAEGRKDEAIAAARSAADLDSRAGKHPVTPGSVLPPRELLGDMLLEMGRPAEALTAYEAALAEAPGRFNSLFGAARAAQAVGDRATAARMSEALLAQCVAGSTRPELAEARRYVAAKPG